MAQTDNDVFKIICPTSFSRNTWNKTMFRRCAYDKCKMPIFRTNGCYWVTCNQCGKSMCFKCESNKMTPYDH